MLATLTSCVSSLTLVEGKEDKWIWLADDDGSYSVKSTYHVLQGRELEEDDPAFKTLWQGKEPSNVIAYGWKVLWGRIQTKTSLNGRGISPAATSLNCVFCQAEEETLEHLLLVCPFSFQIWMKTYRWLGILTALPANCRLHFMRHGGEFWTTTRGGERKLFGWQ